MGPRKNYKASVEVGSEVFHQIFLCVTSFTLFFPPTTWIEHFVPSLVTVASVVVSDGVLLLSSQQIMLLKSSHNTSGPMARIVSHKTGSRISVHGSTVRKWEPPKSFGWQGVGFHAHAKVRQVKFSHLKTKCLKKIVSDWTLVSHLHAGTSQNIYFQQT